MRYPAELSTSDQSVAAGGGSCSGSALNENAGRVQEQVDPKCAEPDTQNTVGKGETRLQDAKESLSDKLARSGGVSDTAILPVN